MIPQKPTVKDRLCPLVKGVCIMTKCVSYGWCDKGEYCRFYGVYIESGEKWDKNDR